MSKIMCDCIGCEYNFNGVCDKSFVEMKGAVCQDKNEKMEECCE